MEILKNTLELVRQSLTNNLLQVDNDVSLKSKKISLCCKPWSLEIYDCDTSLFCMTFGEKVYTIYVVLQTILLTISPLAWADGKHCRAISQLAINLPEE